jgi:hypothetical protein
MLCKGSGYCPDAPPFIVVVPDLKDLRRRVVMSYQVREQLVGEMVEVMRYSVHIVK